ncbi:MAG: trans-2-enoyl-CoA reductase family protein [Verrucomicrobia bacterium]|nr:trans-2-enoyl-CoA reductase family protein [Verrucomicrobiota bacterium]
MSQQVLKPRVRGFICITSHPEGCAAAVREQIAYVKSRKPIQGGPKSVLVIGASTGYGLSSRISAAFGSGAATLGVFFERNGEGDKPGSPGWYNTAGFHAEAKKAGLKAVSINGDAFSAELKAQVIEAIKAKMPGGKIDLVVYSLASPRRTAPDGVTYKSVLKPTGAPFHAKNLDTDRKVVNEVTLETASADDIAQTVKVMGGEDWELWMNALDGAGVLKEGCQTVAYSYIGPQVTWPIYKDGTIGKAKEDLERAGRKIDSLMKLHRGRAFVSVNKAVVTQASSAIPVVPLYVSLLFKIMKAKGTHEGCIEQIQRLFEKQMYNGNALDFDENGRVRIDDWEMAPDVQKAVFEAWPHVTTETFDAHADFAGYQTDFMKNFGFGLAGIDYEGPTEVERPIEDA